jgi:hypothetical protein|tara:strand:+ start:2756 stop:2971 length:216 start_codon:yes stop_codon:yes gene_type:complete
MARRKIGNSHTTICVTWEDKELFRKFAKFVKKTKTGDLFESDSVVFHKLLEAYKTENPASETSNSTYPSKI